MSMQLSVVMIFPSVVYLHNHVNLTKIHLIGLFQVLEILTFKTRPSAQPFLCCVCMRMKNHFQIKGFRALSLVLIQRTRRTRKRLIFVCSRNWLLKIMLVVVRYKKVLHHLWIPHFLRYLFGAFFSIDVNISILHCNDLYLFLNESFW